MDPGKRPREYNKKNIYKMVGGNPLYIQTLLIHL